MKIFILNLIFLISMGTAQNTSVKYKLLMPNPSTHLYEVEICLENISDEERTLRLVMPAWRPGRYLIFDFSSGVQEFNAELPGGEKLKWHKDDKSTWVINTNRNKLVRISYKVFANSFNLRTRELDEKHGFVNGTAVFMYSEKYRNKPVTLEVIPFQNWHVTTGLDNLNGNPCLFTAENYDMLADCPLEIGTQKDIFFELRGKQYIISLFGEVEFDSTRLINDFSKIIEANISFWGYIPYNKYVFILHCTPQSGGGTEHINSTVIGVRPDAFNTNSNISEKVYINFLRLVSHEFFHTWNVKQLRPKALSPYDYTKENYTEELWIAEGSTSYYDGLMILRTGQYSAERFFGEITSGVREEKRRPGNRIQSLAESSFDAWIKFWKQNSNSYNAETDYYAKGSWVSLILDLCIRQNSKNKYSLDNVFRTMLMKYPLGTGYTNKDFINTCEEFCGKSLNDFFDDYLYGTKPLDWEMYLGYAGLELIAEDSTFMPIVGLKTEPYGEKIVITEVFAGSSSEKAGIMVGDEIIAIDSLKLSYNEMENRFKTLQTGQKYKVTVVRDNKLRDFTIALEDMKVPNYKLTKVSKPTELQKSIYESWLQRRWDE
jgi:predicted metalloprotease with PDZ domain